MDKQTLCRMIDHTLLKPEATSAQIIKLCQEARENGFASVCINPNYVSLAKGVLEGSGVKVCTVIGFPLGANEPTTKAFEAKLAVSNGAQELDMVLNIGALKNGDNDLVLQDIQGVVNAGVPVKVILQTCLLTDDEKIVSCQLCEKAGAAFVKTSTGFMGGGATEKDIRLMKNAVSTKVKVKASGGIRTFLQAVSMVSAGADRIGTGSAMAIIQEI